MMASNKITPRELWSRQHISSLDTDYDMWNRKRELIVQFSQISKSCVFTVDVFKERYDFASDNFSEIFGYNPLWIKNIRKQGDLLEERIHPDDRDQILDYQIEHGKFIYSLPKEERNDYCQIFQYRMLNVKEQYVNVISRQQVLEKDSSGNAWIIMGVMDISPDQIPNDRIKRTVINRRTGEILSPALISHDNRLTNREKEILLLICNGFISKEIAYKLNISLYTVNNHRKNILSKLNVDNMIEAIKIARVSGII
jgi:DNA-binding CsgD family transcriptional regulator